MEVLTKVKSAGHKAVAGTKSVASTVGHKTVDPIGRVAVKRLAIHKRKVQINDILAVEGLVILAQERAQKQTEADAKAEAKAAAKAAKEAAKMEADIALHNPPTGKAAKAPAQA